jgi:hypothetical protein
MPIVRLDRRAPNYCPHCGGSFRVKAKVSRLNQKSEVLYLNVLIVSRS